MAINDNQFDNDKFADICLRNGLRLAGGGTMAGSKIWKADVAAHYNLGSYSVFANDEEVGIIYSAPKVTIDNLDKEIKCAIKAIKENNSEME